MRPVERASSLLGYAARSLRRSPGFAAAVVGSLAVGVGANAAVFSLVEHALLRAVPYPRPNEIVVVSTSTTDGSSWETVSYDLAAWQRPGQRLRTVAAVSWVLERGSARVASASANPIHGARAGADLLDVLRLRPALGRWFTHEEERGFEPVVVLSDGLWRRQFNADRHAVGQATLTIDDRPYTVIGVLPPNAAYPVRAEFWYPYPDNLAVEVLARARPGASLADIRSELTGLAPGVELGRAHGIGISLDVATLHERMYGANAPILRLLLATVMLLFLLTCTNVANLSLARTFERRRELSTRAALGATRLALIGHVVAENALLAAGGAALGTLVAVWVTHLLVRLAPAELAGVRGAGVGVGGILVAVAAAMFAAVAVSMVPAFAVARADLRPMMSEARTSGRSGARSRARSALVTVQLALAVLFLTASGLLVRSMAQLLAIDTGFDRRGLAVVQLSLRGERYQSLESRRALVDALVTRVRALPGVRSVAVGPPPLVGGRGRSFIDGYDNIFGRRDSLQPGAPVRSVWVKYVDPAYLETFGITIRAGRGITSTDDRGAPAVALINTAAERLFFPDGPALGRQLAGIPPETSRHTSGGRPISVVGLLPDVRQRDITIPAYPELWLPVAQQDGQYDNVYLSVRTAADAGTLARAIGQAVYALDPELHPRKLSTMDAIVRETLAPQRYVLGALGTLAVVALSLAVVGLYAVVAYLTAARTREFGVRIALGARPIHILTMVLGDGLRLVALGIAIGLPTALASSVLMARFLYGVDPRDVRAFAAAPAVLAVASLVAAYLPARRATRVNPVESLRSD